MAARFFLWADIMSTDYINQIFPSFGFHTGTSKLTTNSEEGAKISCSLKDESPPPPLVLHFT